MYDNPTTPPPLPPHYPPTTLSPFTLSPLHVLHDCGSSIKIVHVTHLGVLLYMYTKSCL